MSEINYMIGPGIASFRSGSELSVFVNTSRPNYVEYELKLYDILIPIIAVLIVIVNLAIIISSGLILHRGQQPRSTYLFLGNVAVSDFVIGSAVLFGQYYPRSYRNEMVCAVEVGLTVSASVTSAYSVGLIAVDRFLYILYGLQYQRYIYPNRARLMILSAWTLGIIIGFLPAMGIRNNTDNGKLCWFIILTPPKLVLATTTVGLIPLAVIIILYSIILYHALRKISQLKSAAKNKRGTSSGTLRIFRGGHLSETGSMSASHQSVPTNSEDEEPSRRRGVFKIFNKKTSDVKTPVYNPSKWKAIKIVLFTTGSFFFTWFPFFVASAMFAVCDPAKTPRYCDGLRVAIASPLAILGLTNSILNPIVYAWWHTGFRESMKKIWSGICRRNSKDWDVGGTSQNRNVSQTRSTYASKGSLHEVESSHHERNPIVQVLDTDNNTIEGTPNMDYDTRSDYSGQQSQQRSSYNKPTAL